jgi:hypothetical protein
MTARLPKVTVLLRGAEYRYRRPVSRESSLLASHPRPRDLRTK